MTADEIRRNWHINGSEKTMPQMQMEVQRELAAQVATLNESRKPRWVNLSSTLEPCLVDATQVIGLSSGYVEDGSNGARPCVYVRLRAQEKPFAVFDMDHDEVRGKLVIDENWMPPAPSYTPYGTVVVDQDEWLAAKAVVEAARAFSNPADTELGATYFDTLKESIVSFDNSMMPF